LLLGGKDPYALRNSGYGMISQRRAQVKQMLAAAGWIAFSAVTASGQGTTGTAEFEVASVNPAAAQDRGRVAKRPT